MTRPSPPIVWTIAGSDSGGGAGVQADLRTFHDFHVHGCSVITALTAQNSKTVAAIAVTAPYMLRAQLDTLQEDLPARAIKTGMLGNLSVIKTLAAFLKNSSAPLVCDPVMIATSGAPLLESDAQKYLIQHIFPHATVITPNLHEAESLTQKTLRTPTDIEQAAQQLLNTGTHSVLIKGGHFTPNSRTHIDIQTADDYFTDGKTAFWLHTPRITPAHTHGAGCSLSAAIAARLAWGDDLPSAIVSAKMYIQQGIRLALRIGQGEGAVAHTGAPTHIEDLPTLTPTITALPSQPFPRLEKPIGFYPIAQNCAELEKLLIAGVDTIQLRNKTLQGGDLLAEVAQAVMLARRYQTPLFINDYWELAIQYGAFGVHLGQNDLKTADLSAILRENLRLGISTHSAFEIAQAHAIRPSYIAVGPVFKTHSKVIPCAPIGIDTLRYWCRVLRQYPVVAIGGIRQEYFPDVLQTGVSGIAVISAVQNTKSLATTVATLRALCQSAASTKMR